MTDDRTNRPNVVKFGRTAKPPANSADDAVDLEGLVDDLAALDERIDSLSRTSVKLLGRVEAVERRPRSPLLGLAAVVAWLVVGAAVIVALLTDAFGRDLEGAVWLAVVLVLGAMSATAAAAGRQ